MYTYIVKRTQIYLTVRQSELLDAITEKTGRTRSDLIREAIDDKYRPSRDVKPALAALKQSAGSWARRETGAAYVERIRAGRLSKLHAK